jgi:hypothetical protein
MSGLSKKRVGSYATCAVCGKHKNPRGRSAPMEMVSGLCHGSECEGYYQPPYAGDLWPGETAEEFGYPCQTTEERNQ